MDKKLATKLLPVLIELRDFLAYSTECLEKGILINPNGRPDKAAK